VVAHVVTNDDLLAETTRAVLAGDPRPYYNHDAVDTTRLSGLGDDLGALADRLRASSATLCDLLDGMDETAAGTPVHMEIRDGDRTALDAPIPWGRAAEIQARAHLPNHTEQARAAHRLGHPALVGLAVAGELLHPRARLGVAAVRDVDALATVHGGDEHLAGLVRRQPPVLLRHVDAGPLLHRHLVLAPRAVDVEALAARHVDEVRRAVGRRRRPPLLGRFAGARRLPDVGALRVLFGDRFQAEIGGDRTEEADVGR
jgi:hypothetical protein